MRYQDVITPSALVSELYAPWLQDDYKMQTAVDAVTASGFYGCIEIAPVWTGAVQRSIRKMLKDRNVRGLCWATKALNDDGLSPCALDKQMREKAKKRWREVAYTAAECGVEVLAITSGPDPGATVRLQAYDALLESTMDLCESIKQYGMRLYLEPLDRFAHKKHLVGPTSEAIRFIKQVRTFFPEAYLAWDSSHVALNEENIVASILQADNVAAQYHLANAVLDPTSSAYGDFHMPLGAPGFLDENEARKILRAIAKVKPHHTFLPTVSIEVRTAPDGNPVEQELHYRRWLANLMQEEVSV